MDDPVASGKPVQRLELRWTREAAVERAEANNAGNARDVRVKESSRLMSRWGCDWTGVVQCPEMAKLRRKGSYEVGIENSA